MNPIQTGIAVALALAVVASFFIFPSLSFFQQPATSENPSVEINTQTESTAMSAETITQLQVTDITIGTGDAAAAGDTVTVNYVGSLTDGTVFDASANHGTTGFTFNLGAGQVIKGWDEGIVGMKKGGKRKLIIPASLAYGSQAVGDVIPANATLVFEVELLKVQKATR